MKATKYRSLSIVILLVGVAVLRENPRVSPLGHVRQTRTPHTLHELTSLESCRCLSQEASVNA